jgi:hypothetical protein
MTENIKQPTPAPAPKQPNETGSVSVQGFLKISDPATRQVFVEKSA